jgi:hypothetical protein
VVTPTSRSPASTAKTLSVKFGAKDTARSIFTGIFICRPKSSVTSRVFVSFCACGFSFRQLAKTKEQANKPINAGNFRRRGEAVNNQICFFCLFLKIKKLRFPLQNFEERKDRAFSPKGDTKNTLTRASNAFTRNILTAQCTKAGFQTFQFWISDFGLNKHFLLIRI